MYMYIDTCASVTSPVMMNLSARRCIHVYTHLYIYIFLCISLYFYLHLYLYACVCRCIYMLHLCERDEAGDDKLQRTPVCWVK